MIQYSYTFDPETRTLTPSGDPVNVKNDTNVVQIVFTMPASYEGLDLSSYVWRVFYKIAMNTKLEEVRFHQFTNPTTEGENLVLTWTVTNSVTEFAGHLGFALSGTLTDTGGNVTNRINSIPAYERIEPTIGGGSYTEDDAEMEGIKDFLVGIQEAAEAAQAAAETAAAEAEASAARAEQIADELEPYKSLAIVESASGDPATFTDGSNGVQMKSVSVDIDPVQDLHGYENPWVGGAGKNLLPSHAVGSQTISGVTFTVASDGTVTVSGTASANAIFTLVSSFTLPSGSYVLNGCPSGGGDGKYRIDAIASGTSAFDYGNSSSFTISASTTFTYSRIIVWSGQTVSNLVFKPMIRLSSVTDATFAPYSNICPISGWDEIKVTRCGKNFFDPSAYESYKTGENSYTATLTQINAIRNNIPRILLNKEITFSAHVGSIGTGVVNLRVQAIVGGTAYNGNSYNAGESGGHIKITFTPTSESDVVKFTYGSGGTASVTFSDLQLEIGSARTDYEPYASQTYPISLTSAGTVYGGTLDAVSGELVVDRMYKKGSDLTLTKSGSGTDAFFYASVPNAYKPANSSEVPSNLISSAYQTIKSTNISGSLKADYGIGLSTSFNRLMIRDIDCGDLTGTEMATKIADYDFVIPLETAQTYTLTPTQITSLLGVNHVWADCGEVSLEYVADTKMYIDKIVASL